MGQSEDGQRVKGEEYYSQKYIDECYE